MLAMMDTMGKSAVESYEGKSNLDLEALRRLEFLGETKAGKPVAPRGGGRGGHAGGGHGGGGGRGGGGSIFNGGGNAGRGGGFRGGGRGGRGGGNGGGGGAAAHGPAGDGVNADGVRVCFTCKEIGHWKTECPRNAHKYKR